MRTWVFLLITLISSPAWGEITYEQLADDTFRKVDNTITVQIIRATYPLNWKDSRGLLLSLLKSRYWFPKTRSTIGHVTTEVNCTVAGNRVRIFSGQGVNDLFSFREKIFAGYGFSILNSPQHYSQFPLLTVPGKLNTSEEMVPRFNQQLRKDNLSVISFRVSQEDCLNAFLFVREYKRQTEQSPLAGNIYGFGANPSAFEGAGCAPYVQTVLMKANLPEIANRMNQTVSVPEELLGNPKAGKIVPWWKLFFQNFSFQGKYAGPQFTFGFPDPQKLYEVLTEDLERPNLLEKRQIGIRESWYALFDFVSVAEPPVDSESSL